MIVLDFDWILKMGITHATLRSNTDTTELKMVYFSSVYPAQSVSKKIVVLFLFHKLRELIYSNLFVAYITNLSM